MTFNYIEIDNTAKRIAEENLDITKEELFWELVNIYIVPENAYYKIDKIVERYKE